MPKKPVNVTIDEEVLQEIDHLAELRGESRSAVMERVIRNGLEDYRKSLEYLGNPVIGGLITKLLESPRLYSTLAALVRQEIVDELNDETLAEFKRVVNTGQKVRAEKKATRRRPKGRE